MKVLLLFVVCCRRPAERARTCSLDGMGESVDDGGDDLSPEVHQSSFFAASPSPSDLGLISYF